MILEYIIIFIFWDLTPLLISIFGFEYITILIFWDLIPLLISIFGSLPQMFKMLRNKSSKNVSEWMYLLLSYLFTKLTIESYMKGFGGDTVMLMFETIGVYINFSIVVYFKLKNRDETLFYVIKFDKVLKN